jgi:hypothetical protein
MVRASENRFIVFTRFFFRKAFISPPVKTGLKRDRLPWAGDLAVSIAANAYSFVDEDCIRWTLTVLGRCGLDDLLGAMRDGSEIDGVDGEVIAAKSAAPDAHVNGMVDYSLWFIVSHRSYQRYFDDLNFLRREWKVIETRLRYLLRRCSDAETGWFVIGDDDRIFIDWTAENNAEKSKPLQIRELVYCIRETLVYNTPSPNHVRLYSRIFRSLVACARLRHFFGSKVRSGE